MREFLASGRYCNFEHPRLQDTLHELTRGDARPVEVAVRCFRFVRDTVRYTFVPWGVPASRTLETREGACTNKSGLLVALLRGAGIPAAYGMLRVNPREYFGNIAPPVLKPLISTSSVHVYAAAYLHDAWVRCDPSTDAGLAAKTSHFNRQTRLIEWDGTQDALDFLQPHHVYADLGLHACIDEALEKAPRHAQPDTLAIINEYVRFIRTQPAFPTAEALIAAYLNHRVVAANGRDA